MNCLTSDSIVAAVDIDFARLYMLIKVGPGAAYGRIIGVTGSPDVQRLGCPSEYRGETCAPHRASTVVRLPFEIWIHAATSNNRAAPPSRCDEIFSRRTARETGKGAVSIMVNALSESQLLDEPFTMRFLIVSAPKPSATTAPTASRKLRFSTCCRAVVIKASSANASTIASRMNSSRVSGSGFRKRHRRASPRRRLHRAVFGLGCSASGALTPPGFRQRWFCYGLASR